MATAIVALLCAACTQSRGSGPAPSTVITGTTTVISTTGTSTVVTTGTVTVAGPTLTSTRITTLPAPSTVGPPPPTSMPAAVPGDCPYITAQAVMDANGQHYGPTSIIDIKPYPICIFTRSDGGYLATTQIVTAANPAQAAAAVNQHVPVSESNPASDPAGWTGGAMATPKGIAGNDLVRSLYAVSKGSIAIIAESNQAQSIKGRQMVEQIVQNLKL